LGGLLAGTAVVIATLGRDNSARLLAGAAPDPYPQVQHFVPAKDAAHPPLVAAPLRSAILRYSIGPTSLAANSPPTSVAYETTYDQDGNWVTRSLGASPSTLQEYRDGLYTLSRDGQVISRTTIEPPNRPYQPTILLTRYGAAFVANQEWLADRRAKTASEHVRGVRCHAGAPCAEVVYQRHGPADSSEEATLVYDTQSKLVWYYGLRVNGRVTQEFKMESALARSAPRLRIEIPSRSLPAGTTMAGELIIDNSTGLPRSLNDANGCQTGYAIVLGNDQIPPNALFTQACVHKPAAIPVGESRFPFILRATYPFCGAPVEGALRILLCLPGGGPPPLPAGLYYATFVDNGTHLPPPQPVAIRVSAP
jgi:hypothetical protein